MWARKLLIVLASSLLSSGAWAATTVMLENVSGTAGSSVNIPIDFNPGAATVIGIQFSLTLPSALSAGTVTPSSQLTTIGDGMTAKLVNGSWNFVAYGLQNTPIPQMTLGTVQVVIAPGTPPGPLTVQISNVAYTDPSFKLFPITGTPGTVTVNAVNTVAMPTFNPSGGTFTTAVQVSIQTVTPNAVIYYTLDGTDPGTSSPIYGGPIPLNSTKTLKARAYAAGLTPSMIASATYTITGGSTLPDPDISSMPNYAMLSDHLTVTYDPSLNVSFLWTFTPTQGPISYTSEQAGAPAGMGGSISFKSTSAQTPSLASQDLTLGAYQVTVQAQDNTNPANLSNIKSKGITLVGSDFSQVRVFPNPWRIDKHSSLPITFDHLPVGATIKIFTVSGHWVKTLIPSVDTVTWDRTNDSGSSVASGVYVYLITVGDSNGYGGSGQKTRGQLVIIR